MHKQRFLMGMCFVIGMSFAYGQQTEITGKNNIPDAPSWVADAVFYQIYPQTYYDSNGDGIGDLNGIIQKLDYIKSLGVTAIWLNPFFDSPFNDAGYDTRDYYKVAPRYGTNEDAKRLFQEAHKRGLKVIFDYVITYTAIDHPWFVESCKGTPNKYTNWYVWNDNVWKMEEGEFANRFIQGYGQRNGNFMRNFYWSEPALNFGFGKPDSSKAWQLPTNHPDVLALREELKRSEEHTSELQSR
jgi:maltose alpha-D-glucosyltransferase/alpha-amylase